MVYIVFGGRRQHVFGGADRQVSVGIVGGRGRDEEEGDEEREGAVDGGGDTGGGSGAGTEATVPGEGASEQSGDDDGRGSDGCHAGEGDDGGGGGNVPCSRWLERLAYTVRRGWRWVPL